MRRIASLFAELVYGFQQVYPPYQWITKNVVLTAVVSSIADATNQRNIGDELRPTPAIATRPPMRLVCLHPRQPRRAALTPRGAVCSSRCSATPALLARGELVIACGGLTSWVFRAHRA
jgi:hypothetical protein